MMNFNTADVFIRTGKTPALGFMTVGSVRYLFWKEARINQLNPFVFYPVTEATEYRIRCGVYKNFDDVVQNQNHNHGCSVITALLQGLDNPQVVRIDSTYVLDYDEQGPDFYQRDFNYTADDTQWCMSTYPLEVYHSKTSMGVEHLDAYVTPDCSNNDSE